MWLRGSHSLSAVTDRGRLSAHLFSVPSLLSNCRLCYRLSFMYITSPRIFFCYTYQRKNLLPISLFYSFSLFALTGKSPLLFLSSFLCFGLNGKSYFRPHDMQHLYLIPTTTLSVCLSFFLSFPFLCFTS